MSPDLQDRKIKLLKELEAIEARLMEKELSEVIEAAWQHVVEARALIQTADALDRETKRERDEAKRLARQEKKAKLEAQILEAEAAYRTAAHDALSYLVKTTKRALKADEQAFLNDPATSPVSLSEATYLAFDEYHARLISQARGNLADLRKQLGAV